MPIRGANRLGDRNAYSSDCDLELIVNEDHSFILNKTHMLRRSGRIRKMLKGLNSRRHIHEVNLSQIQMNDFPGVPEIFELAVRFCYCGKGDLITAANIVELRCAAEYLDMSEQYGKQNLIKKTEVSLRHMLDCDWQTNLDIFRSCEAVLPFAEKTRIVQRCADSLAWKVYSSFPESNPTSSSTEFVEPRRSTDSSLCESFSKSWWFRDVSTLSIYLMERVLKALIEIHADNKTLAKFLLYYLHFSLPILGYSCISSKIRKSGSNEDILHSYTINVQRELLESIVCLLSFLSSNSASCRSLFSLFRIASALNVSESCKWKIEGMIGAQLYMATLDHLMVKVNPTSCTSKYDVDLVLRLLHHFLKELDHVVPYMMSPERTEIVRQDHASGLHSTVHSRLSKVGDLMDKYLTEIAPDVNLKPIKFQELAEALPASARTTHDGLYRAVNIYLEVHATSITEEEACNISKVVDYKKLSFDESKHLAQNPGFPARLGLHSLLLQQVSLRTKLGAAIFKKDCVGVAHGSLQNYFAINNEQEKPLEPSWDIQQFLQHNEVLKLNLHELESKVVELENLCTNVRFHMIKKLSSTGLVC